MSRRGAGRSRTGREPKVREGREAAVLEQLPNIGPSLATDLRRLGIRAPAELTGRDPYALYESLCHVTGRTQDPCVLDVFIASVRFMEGAPPRPWWHYTPERKRTLAVREGADRRPAFRASGRRRGGSTPLDARPSSRRRQRATRAGLPR